MKKIIKIKYLSQFIYNADNILISISAREEERRALMQQETLPLRTGKNRCWVTILVGTISTVFRCTLNCVSDYLVLVLY